MENPSRPLQADDTPPQSSSSPSAATAHPTGKVCQLGGNLLENPIRDEHVLQYSQVIRRTLSRIPSMLGRLVYLSSLRNRHTDAYRDPVMSRIFGEKATDGILRQYHLKILTQWLCLTLQQQAADLGSYLSADEAGERHTFMKTCLRLGMYQSLLPSDASDPERNLFLNDLEAVLTVLPPCPARARSTENDYTPSTRLTLPRLEVDPS